MGVTEPDPRWDDMHASSRTVGEVGEIYIRVWYKDYFAWNRQVFYTDFMDPILFNIILEHMIDQIDEELNKMGA